ncbi:MAG: FHA domain-containing protein [Victivallales bacterium]|nr:FHA domain-containing protein [Victivallales bacterium]
MVANPKLIILSEKLRGKSFELDKDLVTVGRTDKADICIKDATISTGHCDFTRDGDIFILNDRGSTNGTRINNVPVPEGGQELKNSDILQFGAVEIFFDSNDGSSTSITRTHTGIELDSTEVGLSTVKGLGNFSPYEKGGKGGMSQKVMLSLVLLLILAIVFLIGYAVYAIYSGTSEKDEKANAAKRQVLKAREVSAEGNPVAKKQDADEKK